ncbi:MAG: glycosyltransferase [Nanoarchaeota archaeon]|nr:glycosyltransferase [Nanoarchaeota archaeon]
MKVLFNCNTTAFQAPGGGEILLLKTLEYLKKNKIKVKLFNKWEDNIKNFDLLHSFGLSNNCHDLINYTHKKIPIVVTTIYSWPSIRFALKSGIKNKDRLKLSAYAIKHNFPIINKSTTVKKILDKANLIIPDSWIEAKLLSKKFNIKEDKFYPVPNGVDKRFYKTKPNEFIKKYGLKDFVLYAGRVEPRKNVLNLIKSLNKTKIPLVIIGSPSYQGGKEYYNLCKKIANKNIHFIKEVSHESTLLESAYAASKVTVLPSWLETPGLSALEGGLAGSNIVITSRGTSIDYFKNHALYINPFDNKDIKNKIIKAYNKEKNKELAEHIKKNFLWDILMKKLIKGYKKII